MTEENLVPAGEARKRLRRKILNKQAEKAGEIGTNQPNPEEGLFNDNDMKAMSLLTPPYNPVNMLRFVENSTMLAVCIETYQKNIHGYGYEFRYVGPDERAENNEVKNCELFDYAQEECELTHCIYKPICEVGEDE